MGWPIIRRVGCEGGLRVWHDGMQEDSVLSWGSGFEANYGLRATEYTVAEMSQDVEVKDWGQD